MSETKTADATTETKAAETATETQAETKTVETAENPGSLAAQADAGAAKAAETKTGEGEKAPEIPSSADQYDFTVPAEIGLKDEKGEPFQFAKDDPLIAEAGKFFLEGKVPKETASKLIGLYAKAVKEAADATTQGAAEAAKTRAAQELAKLETTSADGKKIAGSDRINSVLAGLDSVLGEGASKKFAPGITSADIALGLEKLVAMAAEGGAGKQPPGAGDKYAGLSGEALLKAIRAEQRA